MLHPANLLLAWMGAVVIAQQLTLSGLMVMGGGVVLMAALLAPTTMGHLLRRIRWVVLMLAVLFIWMTPGVYVPGMLGALGVTGEGLVTAWEHILRLLSVVALLALLLSRLSTNRIVMGLYTLLRPLAWLGVNRCRLAVRLMLTLELVVQPRKIAWQEWMNEQFSPDNRTELTLPVQPWSCWDVSLGLGLGLASIVGLMS